MEARECQEVVLNLFVIMSLYGNVNVGIALTTLSLFHLISFTK